MFLEYDLIIVGGGPAGTTLALFAHRAGLKTLLLDKARFPRDKICGDAIVLPGIKILEELELTEALHQEPHSYSVNFHCFTESEHLQAPGSHCLMVKRLYFDHVLFTAAKAVVDTCEGAEVEQLLQQEGQVYGVRGRLQNQEEFEFTAKVVVGADGCGSVVAKKARVFKFEPQHYGVATRAYYRHLPLPYGKSVEFYYFQECLPGYLWIFPVDQETVNVGVGVEPSPNQALPKLHQQLLESPLLKSRFAEAELIGQIQAWSLPLASKQRKIHGNGFILIGDAAGLIDPFWGDGIDKAMLSAKVAAQVLTEVCRGQDYSAAALQDYPDSLWSQLGTKFQYSCRLRQRFHKPPFFPLMTRMEILNQFNFRNQGKIIKPG